MTVNIARLAMDTGPRWAVVKHNGVVPLSGDYPTTAALIEHGEDDWQRASRASAAGAFSAEKVLSPITAPCRIFCQGAN